MGLIQSLRSFEASLPRRCMFCSGGSLLFLEQETCVVCMNSKYSLEGKRRKKGEVMPSTLYAPLMSFEDSCDAFAPMKVNSKKAALLDAMGYFNDMPPALKPLGTNVRSD